MALRNNGIITEKEYVGKTLEEATKYATDGGFTIRIAEKDGTSFMLTMDFRTDRINFRVKNGLITGVFGG